MSSRRSADILPGTEAIWSNIGRMAAIVADAGEAVYSLSSSLREQNLDEVIWNVAKPRPLQSGGHRTGTAAPPGVKFHPFERGRFSSRPARACDQRTPHGRGRSTAEARLRRAMKEGDMHGVLALSRMVQHEFSGDHHAARTSPRSADELTSDDEAAYSPRRQWARRGTQWPTMRSPARARAPVNYERADNSSWFDQAHGGFDGTHQYWGASDGLMRFHSFDSDEQEEVALPVVQRGASVALRRGHFGNEPDHGREEESDRHRHTEQVKRVTEMPDSMEQRVSSRLPCSEPRTPPDCHDNRPQDHAARLERSNEMRQSTTARHPFEKSHSALSDQHCSHVSTGYHYTRTLGPVVVRIDKINYPPTPVTQRASSHYQEGATEGAPAVDCFQREFVSEERSSDALNRVMAMQMQQHVLAAANLGRQPSSDVEITLLPAATRCGPPSSNPVLIEPLAITTAEPKSVAQLSQQDLIVAKALTTPTTQGIEAASPMLATATQRARAENQLNRQAAALQAMRTEGKVIRRVGAISILTQAQVKQQLALRSSTAVAAGDTDALRTRLTDIVSAEVVAREAAEGPDSVTSEGEMERLSGLGLGRKRKAIGSRRTRSVRSSTSTRSWEASEESEGGADILQAPDVHKVERILDMKVNADGGREFLIKWQGWSAKWNGAQSPKTHVDHFLSRSPPPQPPPPPQISSQPPVR